MVSWQLDFSTASHDPARLVVFSNKDRPDVFIPTEKTGSFLVVMPRGIYSLTAPSTQTPMISTENLTPISHSIRGVSSPGFGADDEECKEDDARPLSHKAPLAHEHAPMADLMDIVKELMPTVLIGAAAIKPDVKEKEPYSFPHQVLAPQPYLLLAEAGGDHLHPPALLPGATLYIQAVSPFSFAPGVRVDLCLPGQAHATLHAPR
jgi:hypothetical protein